MRRALLTVALLFVACGGNALEQGREMFNAGRYADAKARLENVDSDTYRGFDVRTRTMYALYRGLVFGALGDRSSAKAWLGLAKQIEESHPSSLAPDDAVRLKLAEQQYGALPPTSEPPPSR
jgi:hypothetical protein